MAADLSPVETLVAAAAKLRKASSEASKGPWTAHSDGLVWPERIGDPVSGSTEPEDAEWIALVNPDLAEPLAALLDVLLPYARLPQTQRYPIVARALAVARMLSGVSDDAR